MINSILVFGVLAFVFFWFMAKMTGINSYHKSDIDTDTNTETGATTTTTTEETVDTAEEVEADETVKDDVSDTEETVEATEEIVKDEVSDTEETVEVADGVTEELEDKVESQVEDPIDDTETIEETPTKLFRFISSVDLNVKLSEKILRKLYQTIEPIILGELEPLKPEKKVQLSDLTYLNFSSKRSKTVDISDKVIISLRSKNNTNKF